MVLIFVFVICDVNSVKLIVMIKIVKYVMVFRLMFLVNCLILILIK